MNFCRRCESDYEKPGTCNCFAEGGDAKPAEVKPAPTFPPGGYMPAPDYPYPVYPIWWGQGWWGIYPPSDWGYVPCVPVTTTTVETTDPMWSSSTVRIESVGGQGSWTTTIQ